MRGLFSQAAVRFLSKSAQGAVGATENGREAFQSGGGAAAIRSAFVPLAKAASTQRRSKEHPSNPTSGLSLERICLRRMDRGY